MAPTAHLQASGKPGQVRRRLRSQPAGQLELLPGFSRPFRAWENGVANPGRRSPAGFALGYSLLPRRGCQQDGVTAPRASAITEESAGWNKRISRENAQEAHKGSFVYASFVLFCGYSSGLNVVYATDFEVPGMRLGKGGFLGEGSGSASPSADDVKIFVIHPQPLLLARQRRTAPTAWKMKLGSQTMR